MDFHGLFHFNGFLATLRSGTWFIAIASPQPINRSCPRDSIGFDSVSLTPFKVKSAAVCWLSSA
jgi:hypothetical protein